MSYYNTGGRNINDVCHRFYNDNITRTSDIDTPTAILLWQIQNGYDTGHTSTNWLAISKVVNYDYNGDIDIQNRFATLELTLPVVP